MGLGRLYADLCRTARSGAHRLSALTGRGPNTGAPPNRGNLLGYLRDTLLPSALTGFACDLRTLADEGKAMLLLDGLDEVPQADDPRRREQVKALIAALVNDTPKLRIIQWVA